MKRLNVEIAVGLFVLAGILCLAWLSIRLGKLDIAGDDSVPMYAEFSSVAGLKEGGSVEIAGVPVGKVAKITVKDYKAHVLLRIRKGIALQDDAIASVRTRGLIGEKYVSLTPGASERLVPAGGKIRDTEGAVDFESLIGEFIHGKAK